MIRAWYRARSAFASWRLPQITPVSFDYVKVSRIKANDEEFSKAQPEQQYRRTIRGGPSLHQIAPDADQSRADRGGNASPKRCGSLMPLRQDRGSSMATLHLCTALCSSRRRSPSRVTRLPPWRRPRAQNHRSNVRLASKSGQSGHSGAPGSSNNGR